jgi:nicotinate-nucleotide adenylyltransferase
MGSLQSDMRLGYLGGSFDPPHLGHLAVAQAAADSYALSHVLLVPTAYQPLKPLGAVAAYSDRLAMVSLLCESDPRLVPSDLEAPVTPPTPNYTIDTLKRIRSTEPDAELFVIVGADAFLDLPHWRSPDELLDLAEWIVVTRPHLASGALHNGAEPPISTRSLPGLLPLPPLTPAQHKRVHLLPTLDHPASATDIRAELAQGGSCQGMLSPSLLAYIHQHHLYSPAPLRS